MFKLQNLSSDNKNCCFIYIHFMVINLNSIISK